MSDIIKCSWALYRGGDVDWRMRGGYAVRDNRGAKP
jgi:hypothetical protein